MSTSPVDRDLPETVQSAIEDPGPTRAPRRHSAQVTSDRLEEHLATFELYLTQVERVSMNRSIMALEQIPGRIRAAGGDEQ